ncbi:rhodanese-like domain-containing protein [Nocardia sp. NPDC050413]|uniref:sulfurtransferase n=1 Tax=Nocardia sp. NPDC050413 TaxID=3155784 RepID=UPI0033ED11E2
MTSRIVDAQWVRDRRADAVVIEVTNARGPASIPGARSVYWKDLLWDRSRREFPTARELADRLHSLGAHADAPLVFAGDPPQFAAYALWVAAAVGIGGDLRYLDGCTAAWPHDGPVIGIARSVGAGSRNRVGADAAGQRWALDVVSEGTASRTADVSRTPLPLASPRFAEVVVDREQVRAAIDSPTVLLDLRSPEEFAGLRVSPSSEPVDHGAERHGHIPGALNLPAQDLLDPAGLLRPADEIAARIAELGIADADDIVAYCRLSHRAALGWLVFTYLLGDHRVRVYDGSWTEWGSLVGAPVHNPADTGVLTS